MLQVKIRRMYTHNYSRYIDYYSLDFWKVILFSYSDIEQSNKVLRGNNYINTLFESLRDNNSRIDGSELFELVIKCYLSTYAILLSVLYE